MTRPSVLIIGAGLAGLTVALSLPKHYAITLLAKSDLTTCASDKAQGGVAAVLAAEDDFNQHIQDTLVASAHLAEYQAVANIVQHAPKAIQWLMDLGVPFNTHENSELHLTREGGHGQRRIAHVDDQTGHAIMQTLQSRLHQQKHIQILTGHRVNTLLHDNGRIAGAICQQSDGSHHTLLADYTVLATGGLGQLFAHTTNPETATGDGIALAWQAGCRVANLEFVQFHPTALNLPNYPVFLISEALRGEGGWLINEKGERFMLSQHPLAELAPRDIVARAIAAQKSVYLDMRHLGKDFIWQHFPTIAKHCLDCDLDIVKQPIPVAPAVHYACGGVISQTNGQTDVPHLFAVGEVAYTGLHGANRLASNSLLECLTIGLSASQAIVSKQAWQTPKTYPNEKLIHPHLQQEPPSSTQQPFSLNALQHLMSKALNIVREQNTMEQALWQLRQWQKNVQTTQDTLPLQTAILLCQSAILRQESRGTHCRLDFPDTVNEKRITVLRPHHSESKT